MEWLLVLLYVNVLNLTRFILKNYIKEIEVTLAWCIIFLNNRVLVIQI
jgi:hypothetical protein